MIAEDYYFLEHEIVMKAYEINKWFFDDLRNINYPIKRIVKKMEKNGKNIINFLAFSQLYADDLVINYLNKYIPDWKSLL